MILILSILLIGILSLVTSFFLNSYASVVPVESINFTSTKISYENQEPGSWQVTKNAEWISSKEVQITLEVDTIFKENAKNRDVILVLDKSDSISEEDFNVIQDSSKQLVNKVLENSENKMALITYSGSAELSLKLVNSDNKDLLLNKISNLNTSSGRNYYKALSAIEELLNDYQNLQNRDCLVLFLTNGYADNGMPNDVVQYNYLKQKYPFLTIKGIEYQKEGVMFDSLDEISDEVFKVTSEDLTSMLLGTSGISYQYDSFLLTDVIDYNYFNLSTSQIESSFGTVNTTDEKVIWNLQSLSSGKHEYLKFNIILKEAYLEEDRYFSVNEEIISNYSINGIEENITVTETPVLVNHYTVTYDINAPTDCNLNSEITTSERREIFSTVSFNSSNLECGTYQFKGWEIITDNVSKISTDYFIMPEKDVEIRGIWSNMAISKTMSGEIYVEPDPIIQSVALTSDGVEYSGELWGYKSQITKVVFQNEISDVSNSIATWDISAEDNGSVMAHLVTNNTDSSNITYTAYIQGNDRIIANSDSSALFMNFVNLESIEGLEYFDTSGVWYMDSMFSGCESLVSVDLSSLDVSYVLSMYGLFGGCTSLVSVDLTNFNTIRVRWFTSMFYNCDSLVNLNLTSLDTSNAVAMNYMFAECSNLVYLDLWNFNTSNVTDMGHMFYNCQNLGTLYVTSFDTSSVTNMEGMFASCSMLSSIDLSKFNTLNVTNMRAMFSNSYNITSLDLSSFNTGNVTTMSEMFNACDNLTNLNVSSFDTSKVTNMYAMFRWCCNITTLEITNFNTSSVTTMREMFDDCHKLTTLNVSNFDTANVTNMALMFYKCHMLSYIDTSNFITSKVTTMQDMFSHNSSLSSLNLTSFDTSSVVTFQGMFANCPSLTSLDLNSFYTPSVTNLSYMFYTCSKLVTVEMNNFNTSAVTTLSGMFQDCPLLKSLNLSSFYTPNLTSMDYTFAGCLALESLDFRNATFTGVVTNIWMIGDANLYLKVIVKDTTAKNWMKARLTECSNTSATVVEVSEL